VPEPEYALNAGAALAARVMLAPVIVGAVSVLFVSVSVVALPTRVSVEVGRVSVPVLEIVAITGLVSVLFVSVSVVALPTRVSVATGNVRTLDPATAGAARVIVPLVSPAIITELIVLTTFGLKLQ
tara:strand:+ start:2553 stop:2930 length:378 start_codon:yes stop_codon:yes gene_type:complete